jgi:DNA-binding transcriptional ArsR family regulator
MPRGQSKGGDREALSAWMKQQFAENQAAHDRRVEILRTAGEHPSPIFSAMVKNLGMLGLPHSFVAKMLNISPRTIEVHYKDDYELGAAEMIAATAANAIRIAQSTTDPNAARVAMDILARRGGDQWKPAVKLLEIDRKVAPAPTIDSSRLSPALREQLRQELLQMTQGEDTESGTPSDSDS